MSVTGEFFDIGMLLVIYHCLQKFTIFELFSGTTIKTALKVHQQLLDPKYPRPDEPPSMNPEESASGNGSLMRLSPVPAALHRDPPAAIETALLRSRVTHSSQLCLDACTLATAYIIGFYHAEATTAKERKEVVLNPAFTPFADGRPIPLNEERIKDLHEHHPYKNQSKDDIVTSGFVLATLQSALWALWHGNTFEEVDIMRYLHDRDADNAAMYRVYCCFCLLVMMSILLARCTGNLLGLVMGTKTSHHGGLKACRSQICYGTHIRVLLS